MNFNARLWSRARILVESRFRSFCQELSHLHRVDAGDVADQFVRGNVSRANRKNEKQKTI